MFLRINLLSYLGETIPRQQPLLTLISKKRTKIPTPAANIHLSIPDLISPSEIITEHQRTIFRYVAGWMIHSLQKKYPNSDEVGSFLDGRVRRLIMPTQRFEQLIERLLISLSLH